MIKPGEIQTIANRQQVKDTQIEKDYIITWVLYGISNNIFLRDRILFKGGTVLKKCYFPDYRFSEDLDFTSMTEELDKDKLLTEFQAVFDWIYDESRIRLILKDTTDLSTGNINFYIGYIGPLGGDGTKKDLKVDISQDEKIYFDEQQKNIQSAYSDSLEEIRINCYSLGEVIAEKMRTRYSNALPQEIYMTFGICLRLKAWILRTIFLDLKRKPNTKDLMRRDSLRKYKQRRGNCKSSGRSF